jgi:hypothetical protein
METYAINGILNMGVEKEQYVSAINVVLANHHKIG